MQPEIKDTKQNKREYNKKYIEQNKDKLNEQFIVIYFSNLF